jgi:thiamine transport system ATP-binding protein
VKAPALELDHVVFSRPGGFSLRADLAVAPGEHVAIMGPSGSGKSTLLDLIAGFAAPRSGRVRFGGEDLTEAAPAARPVSILFQDNNLFGHLDAFANAALGVSPGLRLDAGGRERVAAALARVGLAGREHRLPHELSGGERQRVALARVLLRRRSLLLLDEPFASLGPALAAEMLALVGEVAADAGAAVLLATHDPDQARALARRTVFLEKGAIVADGLTARILAQGGAVGDYLGVGRPARRRVRKRP